MSKARRCDICSEYIPDDNTEATMFTVMVEPAAEYTATVEQKEKCLRDFEDLCEPCTAIVVTAIDGAVERIKNMVGRKAAR